MNNESYKSNFKNLKSYSKLANKWSLHINNIEHFNSATSKHPNIFALTGIQYSISYVAGVLRNKKKLVDQCWSKYNC